ncbi:unnamed protein product [Acanthoscelides obtectus]|uniref:PiggyBac transposable element-derived protein domain-containing protein n=1 Tax=Acanthoscelides obtectus TaxID=200917 RepID=A0A9P0KDP3_ACAOB|nr:unnamed protein product [Acanthoscelides obtectus]CAK1664254.1 hypothetical protein AOBTE_LOCUS24155 [Acanthoscelides obtectus]
MEIERQRKKYVANCGFVNETDVEEILALIGLLYMTGCRKDNHLTTAEMWSKHGPEVYRCVMSETRFRFLISCLRFDDKTMRDREDKLSPVHLEKVLDMSFDVEKLHLRLNEYLALVKDADAKHRQFADLLRRFCTLELFQKIKKELTQKDGISKEWHLSDIRLDIAAFDDVTLSFKASHDAICEPGTSIGHGKSRRPVAYFGFNYLQRITDKGFLGTPAGITTTSALFKASLRLSCPANLSKK